jgi:hypothetical protein
MQATISGSILAWRAPSTRIGWARRVVTVTLVLLAFIPFGLTLLRELVAQSWNAVAGPFDHISIFVVMFYCDSAIVSMLVCIGVFEVMVWKHLPDVPLAAFLSSKWWWLMLVPCIAGGQQLLEHFEEPRLGPVIYQQAWIFDWYHDLVAGLVIHQLLATAGLLWVIGWRQIRGGAAVALVAALLLLATYGVVWSRHPEKHVIEDGVTINLERYGGQWMVDRLFWRQEDN